MMNREKKQIANKLYKFVLIVLGTIFLGLGIIGIFLPLLPTTPFLLLAAACYFRSSEKFYNLLINNKYVGDYIRNYREGKGIPLKAKVSAVSFLWITIIFSILFYVNILFVEIILILIAIAVSIHILSMRTIKS